MKKIGDIWWVFSIIGTIATLLNPYVGLFAITNVGELFFMAVLYINIVVRIKEFKKHNKDKLLKLSMKPLCIVAYVIPIIFFLVKIFISLCIFILAYRSKEIAAPYQVWSNPDEMSVVCLIVAMIFNVVLLVSFICKGKSIRRMLKECE